MAVRRTIGPRIGLRQTQSPVMTPQLQQAIKLLQLSNLELERFIAGELESNPLLTGEEAETDVPAGGEEAPFAEVAEPAGERTTGDTPDEAPDDATEESEEPSAANPSDALAAPDGGPDIARDTDADNLWNGDDDFASTPWAGPGASSSAWNTRRRGGGVDDGTYDLESALPDRTTLRDHLIEQITLEFAGPAERMIAIGLVGHLDPSGYLSGDLDEAARMLGCSRQALDAVVARLQTFDPPGVFARSLEECLAIQLRDRDRCDPAMATLLGNLDMLARGDLEKLQKRCGVDRDDLDEMIAEIRSLDPRPATAFDAFSAEPLIPDVLMRPLPDAGPGGGWAIEINPDALPQVLVDRTYYATVKAAARTKNDKRFLTEKLQSANWLVKALDQRATTILKVAAEIVRLQHGFFLHGVDNLRPLVLRDVAEAIDMHESTVSRATAGKYIATPRGIFEFKYFFTAAIAHSAGGAAHSAEAVRQRIRTLIEEEAADAVLSDDGIVEILRREGYGIARRTVAKYREAMRIPSSVERRRRKTLARGTGN